MYRGLSSLLTAGRHLGERSVRHAAAAAAAEAGGLSGRGEGAAPLQLAFIIQIKGADRHADPMTR